MGIPQSRFIKEEDSLLQRVSVLPASKGVPFTLHHQLMWVKDTDPLEKLAGVVYQLPCSECESSYIGETKRPLETRLREHKAAIKRGEVQTSAVTERMWTNQHQPL